MKLYDRYTPCNPQPPGRPYPTKHNPYQTYWKLDADDDFKEEFEEFDQLMELIGNFNPHREKSRFSDLWLKGYFEDSSSPREEKEADHPDILDLLEESS